jgi:hypothetical protein
MRTFWLSLHLPYRCRDSGACCSSGWGIPVEKARVRRIATLRNHPGWLRTVANAPCDVAGVLAVGGDGHCVFHQTDGPRRGCEIRHALGGAAMPAACQHFPRECLIDSRGVSVTLSNYCPTAADLLFTHEGPVAIVDGPPALPDNTAEGLDARDALPPLLAPGMLMDLDGYRAWEAHMVACLAGPDVAEEAAPEDCLARLEGGARVLSEWRPGSIGLCEAIRSLPGADTPAAVPSGHADDGLRLFDLARMALARPHVWPDAPEDFTGRFDRLAPAPWSDFAVVVRRFLAAHAFASWMAYQGRGVVTLVRRLSLVLAVLRAELVRVCASNGCGIDRATLTQAIRQTDLLVVHLADRAELARLLSHAA